MSDGRDATQIALQFELIMPPGSGTDDVHTHGERVTQELLKLEQCNGDFTDSTVSTDAARTTLTVELLLLDETDPSAVLRRALDVIRTAAHAAGGATPDWPSVSEQPERVNMEKTHHLVMSL
ncbi:MULTISPECIES: hypothetical protein [unclassified Nocardiopsis]|uniref:hypothetical protein n=1 Tax=unclassified Nocardiopsis TaxID=2649073 RepID=UPI001F1A9B16|nr:MULTISPECIES: hypothetical protein [unclassified Nocardiopsis]